MDKKIALTNIIDLTNILKNNNVDHWLTCGTLLGYYRDGDFIGHDKDTDLGLTLDNFTPSVLNEIIKKGFKLGKPFGDMVESFELTFNRNGVKTDFFFFFDKGEGKIGHSVFLTTGLEYNRLDYIYSKFNLKVVNFLNHDFYVPYDTLKFIETQYGMQWDIPDKEWHWAHSPKNIIDTGINYKISNCESIFKKWLQNK